MFLNRAKLRVRCTGCATTAAPLQPWPQPRFGWLEMLPCRTWVAWEIPPDRPQVMIFDQPKRIKRPADPSIPACQAEQGDSCAIHSPSHRCLRGHEPCMGRPVGRLLAAGCWPSRPGAIAPCLWPEICQQRKGAGRGWGVPLAPDSGADRRCKRGRATRGRQPSRQCYRAAPCIECSCMAVWTGELVRVSMVGLQAPAARPSKVAVEVGEAQTRHG